jgi:hypothetical protein
LFISRASRNLPSLLSAGLFFSAALVLVAAPVPSGRAQAAQTHVTQASQANQAQTGQTSDLDELGGLSAAAMTNDSGPAGIIPVAKGFNASLGTTSQHDSSSGWSSLLTPNVAYRLDRFFSLDAGIPVYMYINIDDNVGTKAKPVYLYKTKNNVFGDTSLSFHGDASFLTIDYNGTVSMGLPSGNTDYGLGAGQVTYNINNHFEKNLGLFTPDIEFGFGDTSTLVNQRVVKSYVAVGPMAHFQAGTAVDLPWRMSFAADAYEELPLDKNLVYSTTGSGKKKVTTATNTDPAEDNGFITALDIPLSRHITMSGFYSRSLRDREDTAGFSFTFLLRPPPRPREVAF